MCRSKVRANQGDAQPKRGREGETATPPDYT